MAKTFKKDCDCCIDDFSLGVSKLDKISDKDLKEILKDLSGKKQKVGNNLKDQNDRILRYFFDLGEGFEKSNDKRFKNFNNLALDKLRKENDKSSDLAKLFNMGHGNHMFDYMKASDLLLKRSYPEIADGTQEGPIFIPEAYIPEKYTRGVDPDNFEEKLRQYHGSKYPKEKGEKLPEKTENDAFKGNYAERVFYEELRRILIKKCSKSVVLHGTQMILPQVLRESERKEQESDFLIINPEYMYIMALEGKYNLHSQSANKDKKPSLQKGLDQISKIKTILEAFFGNDIDLNEWKFVGALGYVTMADHVKCCSKCKPFVVKSSEIEHLFEKVESGCVKKRITEDYKLLIRNLLYTVFANPGPIVRSKIDEEIFKKIQKQGDYCNILFWTPSQFDLIQLDEDYCPRYKHVLFNSSYSTGKTEVIKAMMKKLMENGQKVHFIFCVDASEKKKPILLLQLENELCQTKFKDFIKFGWVKSKDLQSAVKKYPDHHVFVDEYILDMKENGSGQISQMINQLEISTKETCLWLVIAGVKTEEQQFPDLQQIFKGFHIPEMKLPLRNCGEIIDEIVEDGQQKISSNFSGYGADNKVRLDYKKAIHCIR